MLELARPLAEALSPPLSLSKGASSHQPGKHQLEPGLFQLLRASVQMISFKKAYVSNFFSARVLAHHGVGHTAVCAPGPAVPQPPWSGRAAPTARAFLASGAGGSRH